MNKRTIIPACFVAVTATTALGAFFEAGTILSTSANQTCAITVDGIRCWGDVNRDLPATMIKRPSHLSLGKFGGCGLGNLRPECWGSLLIGDSHMIPADARDVRIGGDGVDYGCHRTSLEVRCFANRQPAGLFVQCDDMTQLGSDSTPPTRFETGYGLTLVGNDVFQSLKVNSCVKYAASGNTLRRHPFAEWSGFKSLLGVDLVAIGESHLCWSRDNVVQCEIASINTAIDYGQATPPTGLSDVRELVAGKNHTCALTGMSVVCWGKGMTHLPAMQNPHQLTAAGDHTCAITDAGPVCWGGGDVGAGDYPRSIAGASKITSFSDRGRNVFCADTSDGERCWGDNIEASGPPPTGIAEGSTCNYADDWSNSDVSRCGVRGNEIVCWGKYYTKNPPAMPKDLDWSVSQQLVCRGDRICALSATGQLRCPGLKAPGFELAWDSVREVVVSPRPLTCALREDDGIICQGLTNTSPSQSFIYSPVFRSPLKRPRKMVLPWNDDVCVITDDGPRCANAYGEVTGHTTALPLEFGPVAAMALHGNSPNQCYVSTAGRVLCYGSYFGMVPNDLPPVSEIAVGQTAACAITTSGTVRCWGMNADRVVERIQDLPALIPHYPRSFLAVDLAKTTSGLYAEKRSFVEKIVTLAGASPTEGPRVCGEQAALFLIADRFFSSIDSVFVKNQVQTTTLQPKRILRERCALRSLLDISPSDGVIRVMLQGLRESLMAPRALVSTTSQRRIEQIVAIIGETLSMNQLEMNDLHAVLVALEAGDSLWEEIDLNPRLTPFAAVRQAIRGWMIQ